MRVESQVVLGFFPYNLCCAVHQSIQNRLQSWEKVHMGIPRSWCFFLLCYNKVEVCVYKAYLHTKQRFHSSCSLIHLSFKLLFSFPFTHSRCTRKYRCVYSLPLPVSNQNPRAATAVPQGKRC